jgi:flagellar biosynthesis anti-sigma factor FlgM
MTSPINNLSGSLYPLSGEGRAAGKSERSTQQSAPAPVQGDRSEVGSASRQAMAAPDFDAAKVESIRKAISEGQYAVDPKRIAESFLALEAMLGPVGRSTDQ